jgi:hypothetical protein
VSSSCTLAGAARLPAQMWQRPFGYGSTHHIGMWRPSRGAHTAFFLLACSVVHNTGALLYITPVLCCTYHRCSVVHITGALLYITPVLCCTYHRCSVVHNTGVSAGRSCDEQQMHGGGSGLLGWCMDCDGAVEDPRHGASCVQLALGHCFIP